MKRVFFGLLVVATALGASAFTNANKANLTEATEWFQTSQGTYSPVLLPGKACTTSSLNPCTLTFPNAIPTDTYPVITIGQKTALEAIYGPATSSSSKSVYN